QHRTDLWRLGTSATGRKWDETASRSCSETRGLTHANHRDRSPSWLIDADSGSLDSGRWGTLYRPPAYGGGKQPFWHTESNLSDDHPGSLRCSKADGIRPHQLQRGESVCLYLLPVLNLSGYPCIEAAPSDCDRFRP